MSWLRALGSFALLASCASSQQQAVTELSQARLARAEQLHADKLAPRPYQHFRKASEQARAARLASPERADRASEARLWLEAAISEAEQLELSRARLEIERQTQRSDELYLASEQARLLAEQQIELRAAGAIARLEAERSLARAALLPAQRIKLSPPEAARAATGLLTRAELLLLALPDGPAPEEARARLLGTLKEARASLTKNPDRALELADRALFSALALLGTLRGAGEPVTLAQKASLVEALQLAGASVRREDVGLRASLPRSTRTAERSLARLCSIALAYPQGQVQLNGAPALTAQLAQQGCQGERFSVARATGGEALSLTFFAY